MNKTSLAGYGFNYACARRLEDAIPWGVLFHYSNLLYISLRIHEATQRVIVTVGG